MGKNINYGTLMPIILVLIFTIGGISELAGHPVNPSYMLVFSFLSFAMTMVQLLEVIITMLPECYDALRKQLYLVGKDDAITGSKAKRWYYLQSKGLQVLSWVITMFSFVIVFSWLLFGIRYENAALANGLTMLTIALFFFSLVIKDFMKLRISNYCLRKKI